MAKLAVYNRQGKEVGTYEVEPTDFAPRINRQLLHDAVVMYQSNQRQGSARTKNRSEVSGSTKKMYRQKGTGNARAGSRRSGVRRGGGHIFALRPRSYRRKMPKKAARLATRMAIASKIRDQEMIVIDDLSLESPKTKEMAATLAALGCPAGQSLLLTTAEHDPQVYLAARNIERVTVAPASDLNALSVLASRRMIVTRAALDWLKQRAADAKPTGVVKRTK